MTVAATVAPEEEWVRELVEQASRDIRPDVRSFVPQAIAEQQNEWGLSVITRLLTDESENVKYEAEALIEHWEAGADR